eukprot:1156647-Pelagomonas_calceolata.AAC.12
MSLGQAREMLNVCCLPNRGWKSKGQGQDRGKDREDRGDKGKDKVGASEGGLKCLLPAQQLWPK